MSKLRALVMVAWRLAALLCAVSMLLPCARAQPDGAVKRQPTILRAKAEKGDAQAQFDLAASYHDGQGVATNYVETVKWFRKAAEQNLAEAQYNLAACYYTGQGVAKDEAEAVKWFLRAAEQNNAEAQYNLAVCFFNELARSAKATLSEAADRLSER